MRSFFIAVASLATATVLFLSAGGEEGDRSIRSLHVAEADARGGPGAAMPPGAGPEARLPELPETVARGRTGLVFTPPCKPFSRPSDLARAKSWMRALRVHGGLPPLDDPHAELDRLAAVLDEATEPTARQNVIFLAVLTLPAEVSHPWLRALLDGPDREDALLALAFDGDREAGVEFAALARTPSTAEVHRLLWLKAHEDLGETGTAAAREVLRSYRAVEVLDREPYFKYVPVAVRARPWIEHPGREGETGLLERWLERYPGHPGSDDVALRLGRRAEEAGRFLDAARWYARSASLPDQDIRLGAVYRLVPVCELSLSPEELDILAHDRGLDTPNRDLVTYIRLRRVAAERGFSTAAREAAGLALAEPLSPIAFAWRDEQPPAEGPDRRPGRIDAHTDQWAARPEPGARLDPPRDTLRLEPALLREQLAAWRKLAELERRAAGPRRADRAAALYAQGAAFYHDPRILFPVYGWQTRNFRYMFGPAQRDGEDWRRFEESSFSCLRAAELFRRVAAEHPDWDGLDRALYSRGLALRKALDYPPLRRWWDETRERARVRELIRAFEECAARCPGSALADDAERAARYWRRTRPDAAP